MGTTGRVLAAAALAAVFGTSGAAADGGEAKKPSLELRSSPRFAFSPVRVSFTAELTGGDDVEDLYCPELEWDWDDGGKSVQESDCPPFEAGVTKLDRRFTNQHEYRRAGTYNVKVTMRRAGKALAAANTRVTVRAGLGDPTMEY